MAKTTFNYKKIKLEDMVNYVIDNDKKDVIDLKQFMETVDEVKLVSVVEADGKPKTYINKKGEIKIKKKQVPTGKKKEKYNFLKAKRAFYEAFKAEIDWTNVPKSASGKVAPKATDLLARL